MNNRYPRREAIVLAGGFGTRLRPVVSDVPKPMALVAGRPFLRYVLDSLSENGFDHVVLAVSYMHQAIEDYFHEQYRNLSISYSIEECPLGTGGAISQALTLCENDWVFILNGDTYLEVDYSALERCINNSTSCIVSSYMMDCADRYGTLSVTACGTVDHFIEKGSVKKGLINGGAYLLKRDALIGFEGPFSFERDYLEPHVGDGILVACEAKGTFIDIGVPDDYERAQKIFAESPVSQKLVLFDRDGTINYDQEGHFCNPDDIQFIESTIEILKRYSNDRNCRIAVVTNQSGIARGLYTEADVRNLHIRMSELLAGYGVRIDAWYFCPHHPLFTGPCSCRKPHTGMIDKALFDFEIDAERCVMYGDSQSDKLAAQTVGIPFIQVSADRSLEGSL